MERIRLEMETFFLFAMEKMQKQARDRATLLIMDLKHHEICKLYAYNMMPIKTFLATTKQPITRKLLEKNTLIFSLAGVRNEHQSNLFCSVIWINFHSIWEAHETYEVNRGDISGETVCKYDG